MEPKNSFYLKSLAKYPETHKKLLGLKYDKVKQKTERKLISKRFEEVKKIIFGNKDSE